MHYTIKTNANAMKINKVKFGAYFQHTSTEKRKLTLKFSTLFQKGKKQNIFLHKQIKIYDMCYRFYLLLSRVCIKLG